MELLAEWATWKPRKPPFVLEADRKLLGPSGSNSALTTFRSWRSAIADVDFGKPGDTRLHLGLLPMPFIGDLRHASIYVLLLNPGLGPHDYYGEYEVPVYRKALLRNLKQDFVHGYTPFIFLDPRYSWHGGFRWWHGKLAKVMAQVAAERKVPFAEVRAALAKELASVELFPYHSAGFRDSGGWLKRLESVNLARKIVSSVVVPRVKSGDAVAIVTRKPELWRLPKISGVVRYSGQQARAAHLTPDSPGGARSSRKWSNAFLGVIDKRVSIGS